MTDAELIYALADSLPTPVIARKMEMRHADVLRILRTQPRQVKRLGAKELREAAGGKPVTAADLAEALEQETAAIRSKLTQLSKAGKARQVGEIRTRRGAMSPLWMIGERDD